MSEVNTENSVGELEIPALGIKYDLHAEERGKLITLSESDFEKIFVKLRELQDQVSELQEQLIEALKREALIKNILNS
jgi:hypothetical protein